MRYFLIALLFALGVIVTLAHGHEDHDDDTVDISEAVVPENPTYHEHVRPILEASCVACHSDGRIASYAPFTMAEDVVFAASDIAFNVSAGIMPPWMPSSLTIPLKNDRSLSETEIATIVAWVEQGAELGDPHDYQAPTATFAFAKVRADLTLQAAEPYVPSEDVQDDYRCFGFPLGG